MKICIIGAGSPYTPELIEELSKMPDKLPVTEICLMDINETRLKIMHGFCLRYIKTLNFDVKITSTTNRQDAIHGCTFVNTQIRVGGNEARIIDERTCLDLGLVGQETTGAGGFMKALRTIPAMLDIARDVEKLAPNAWIINYTNPTGLVAEAVMKNTKAKIAGLCAGGMFARGWTADALGCEKEDVQFNLAGLNHMNFSYNITIKGRPISKQEFDKIAPKVGSVDAELIKELGALPSPYLQYYYHENRRVKEMQPKSRGEEIAEIEIELFQDFANPNVTDKPESLKKRGGGGYSEIAMAVMDAIYNNKDTWIAVNTFNQNTLPFLPPDAVIEVPCIVNAAGITPLAQAPPPEATKGLICVVKNYETLAVEAAVTGCAETTFLALLAHPLVRDYAKAKELVKGIAHGKNG